MSKEKRLLDAHFNRNRVEEVVPAGAHFVIPNHDGVVKYIEGKEQRNYGEFYMNTPTLATILTANEWHGAIGFKIGETQGWTMTDGQAGSITSILYP